MGFLLQGLVNGVRVLTPGEVDRLRDAMGKPSNRVVFDALLFTGLRYAELSQVYEDPSRFDPDRKLIKVDNKKTKAVARSGDTVPSLVQRVERLERLLQEDDGK